MANVFVVKIEGQEGLHKVRLEKRDDLERILGSYGVESGMWYLLEMQPDDRGLALNSIWTEEA